MLAISIACTVLAAIVYGWMQIDQSTSSTTPTAMPASPLESLAAVSSAGDAADREQYSRREDPLPVSSETRTDEVAGTQSLSPAPTALQTTSAARPAATASPPDTAASLAPAAATAPASRPARTLSMEEVALLVEQGQKYIAVGDVVTARTIFRRAAESGDATAALALAATYDPMVLAKLGVLGMGADVEKARAWYQMAESYGSAEATQRLQVLGKQ
jgi:TPR repeat protein